MFMVKLSSIIMTKHVDVGFYQQPLSMTKHIDYDYHKIAVYFFKFMHRQQLLVRTVFYNTIVIFETRWRKLQHTKRKQAICGVHNSERKSKEERDIVFYYSCCKKVKKKIYKRKSKETKRGMG